MKAKKITERDRKLVADILTQFMFMETVEDAWEIWNNLFQQYGLKTDPFTTCPCSPEQYYDACEEKNKQRMLDKYGYEE